MIRPSRVARRPARLHHTKPPGRATSKTRAPRRTASRYQSEAASEQDFDKAVLYSAVVAEAWRPGTKRSRSPSSSCATTDLDIVGQDGPAADLPARAAGPRDRVRPSQRACRPARPAPRRTRRLVSPAARLALPAGQRAVNKTATSAVSPRLPASVVEATRGLRFPRRAADFSRWPAGRAAWRGRALRAW